jgi:hypothetical protein
MVGGFRDFSHSGGKVPYRRGRDSEAPDGFRQELVDLVFTLAGDTPLGEEHFHRVITQSIGERVSGSPYGGYRYAAGRDVGKAEWVRVYDLLPRLALEFERFGLYERFQRDTNKLLAAYGISWDLDETGQLVRVLPKEASAAVDSAIHELSSPQFASARSLLADAVEAYNARPQRPRDACANAFDAVESIGKTVLRMPGSRLDGVLRECNKRQLLTAESIRMLDALNIIRHQHFGHGTAAPFSLSSQEVDFVYIACIGAIVLFARMST